MTLIYPDAHARKRPDDANKATNELEMISIVVGNDEPPQHGYYTAGIHPWFLTNLPEQQALLEQYVSDKRCVGVGECGLDSSIQSLVSTQIVHFEYQIDLARQHKLPLIVHAVRAHEEVFELKRRLAPDCAWMIHGFRNKPTIAKKYVDLDCYISFGAQLYHDTPSLVESLRLVPLERLLLETDESEVPIAVLYQKIAGILGLSEFDLVSLVQTNWCRLYGMGHTTGCVSI
jgi:TatD DNase family protein